MLRVVRFVLPVLVLTACAKAPMATVSPLRGESDNWMPVRVGLFVDQADIRFESVGKVEALDEHGNILLQLDGTHRWRVLKEGGLLRLEVSGRARGHSSSFVLRLRERSARWKSAGNVYAGGLKLLQARTGVTLVNVVPMEEYLRGVVPWEIGRPSDDALEAVKAQAIAARTYTYAHLGHWEDLGFDVYDTVSDQVYRGLTGTHPITDRAVRETRNLVAAYRGKLIRAYYSSTCGGHTSTLEDVWTREPAPYLVGRRDGSKRSWCRESPHFRWSEGWSARQLGEVIRSHLPAELRRKLEPEEIGALRDLRVLRRDGSGRVQELEITTDRATFVVWGDRIRWVMRPIESRFMILRSTFFELELIHREGRLVAVRANGGGNGHGVGMCQTGALGMARAGYDADAILEHYYEGTSVIPAGTKGGLP